MKGTSIILLISSFLVTVLLYYIDDGNYHLKGILEPGNMLALAFYFVGILISKLLLIRLLGSKLKTLVRLPLVIISGSVMGSVLVAGFFVYGIPALRAIV